MSRPALVDCLESFNRKERFFLVAEALGNRKFSLCAEFKKKLHKAFHLPEFSEDVFVAMDYHLDWLYAALVLATGGAERKAISNPIPDSNPPSRIIQGNQEDIDLLVAFEAIDGVNHVLLLEAKVESPWDKEQLERKFQRLDAIFADIGGRKPGYVRPHFATVSADEEVSEEFLAKVELRSDGVLNGASKPVHIRIEGPISPRHVVR